MEFKLFKNPNYSLEPNDIIKIISVYPEDPKKRLKYLLSTICSKQY